MMAQVCNAKLLRRQKLGGLLFEANLDKTNLQDHISTNGWAPRYIPVIPTTQRSKVEET
jgi:hypothetical protein